LALAVQTVHFEETALSWLSVQNAFWLFDTFVQGHRSPHLAMLPATKLRKEEHGTISSERHINYIIDPALRHCYAAA